VIGNKVIAITAVTLSLCRFWAGLLKIVGTKGRLSLVEPNLV